MAYRKSILPTLGLTMLYLAAVIVPAAAQSGKKPAHNSGTAKNASSEQRQHGKPGLSGADRSEEMADMVLNQMVGFRDAHWHKGEYCHIVNLSRMNLAGWPDDLDTYANTGWLLWSMNRDDEAVALFEQGLKLNPNTSYMYDELGHYYYNRKKDYHKAIEYYEQAAKFPDVKSFTLHLLAHAYERTGQLEKSLQCWERAVQIPGETTGAAKVNLERVKRLLSQNGKSKT